MNRPQQKFTGVFLAGVYPPGMKIIATWFRTGRGFALGVLIGALTLGKAVPYLVNAFGSESWRVNAAFASIDLPVNADNVCAVVAVTDQESNFRVDPPVPGLSRIAWSRACMRT